MRNARGAMWCVLALSAIVLAAGLTWSVMRLAGERIGLASAPVSVVRGLAPGPGAQQSPAPEHDVMRTVTETVTVSRTVTVAASTTGANTQAPSGGSKTDSRTGSAPTGVTRAARSAITITPPAGTHTTTGGSDDARERASTGGGRDD